MAGGIVVIHEGIVLAIAEWGMGGDTSDAPDFWWESVYNIVNGAMKKSNISKCTKE